MGDLIAIQNKKNQLIRKVLAASVFMGPTSLAVPTTFTSGASADLTALPAGWKDVGLVTKDDAYSWSREADTSETTSHGFTDPTRRDINSTVNSVAFSMQETKKQAFEVFYNVDLSAVQGAATTGEVAFSEPLAPATKYYRVIAIGQDGAGANAIYLIKILSRAMVSEFGDQAWSDTDELVYPVTLTATPDTTLGYSIRHVFAGPGWKSLLTDAGFELAS